MVSMDGGWDSMGPTQNLRKCTIPLLQPVSAVSICRCQHTSTRMYTTHTTMGRQRCAQWGKTVSAKKIERKPEKVTRAVTTQVNSDMNMYVSCVVRVDMVCFRCQLWVNELSEWMNERGTIAGPNLPVSLHDPHRCLLRPGKLYPHCNWSRAPWTFRRRAWCGRQPCRTLSDCFH